MLLKTEVCGIMTGQVIYRKEATAI